MMQLAPTVKLPQSIRSLLAEVNGDAMLGHEQTVAIVERIDVAVVLDAESDTFFRAAYLQAYRLERQYPAAAEMARLIRGLIARGLERDELEGEHALIENRVHALAAQEHVGNVVDLTERQLCGRCDGPGGAA
jgi:hypothetical protein